MFFILWLMYIWFYVDVKLCVIVYHLSINIMAYLLKTRNQQGIIATQQLVNMQ
jgi:hypothetical protein